MGTLQLGAGHQQLDSKAQRPPGGRLSLWICHIRDPAWRAHLLYPRWIENGRIACPKGRCSEWQRFWDRPFVYFCNYSNYYNVS